MDGNDKCDLLIIGKECEATGLQRFQEAFCGVRFKYESLGDPCYFLKMGERGWQRYAPPEKKGMPSVGQLHGAPRLGGAV